MPTFTGGLVGYFSYDYIKYSEPKLVLDARDEDGFQDVDLMLFDKVIAFDNLKQKIYIIVNVSINVDEFNNIDSFNKTDNINKDNDFHIEHSDDTYKIIEANYNKAVEDIKYIVDLIKNGEKAYIEPAKLLSDFEPLFSKEEFCEMVEKAKKYIYEGDIFQVVLSNRLKAKMSGSLFDTYRTLRTINPSPYMFYFSGDTMEVAGASPETLVKLTDEVLYTFPLAGTRRRGKTKEEDLFLEKELLADDKELAEHNMLVDLGRNDLGKISKFGSVEVEEYMSIQKYSHVMHIGSTVKGIIREDLSAIDAVNSVLPAGTLSGAPKIRACEIINELENDKRGIYGGAIGYIDFTGNLDTCIAIRIAYKKDDNVYIRSGAGIVYDSKPELEYKECLNKAKAVVTSIIESTEVE